MEQETTRNENNSHLKEIKELEGVVDALKVVNSKETADDKTEQGIAREELIRRVLLLEHEKSLDNAPKELLEHLENSVELARKAIVALEKKTKTTLPVPVVSGYSYADESKPEIPQAPVPTPTTPELETVPIATAENTFNESSEDEKEKSIKILKKTIAAALETLEKNKLEREALCRELEELDNNTEGEEGKVIEPQAVVEQKQEEKLVESLSKKELGITQEEMKKSTPESFEPETTKTNVGLFLRNQVVKLVSGINISKRMKTITGKLRRGVLLGTGILVLWPALSGTAGRISYKPSNVDGKISSISSELLKKDVSEQSKKFIDHPTYEKLPENAKKIYLYAARMGSGYVIVDKPTATMFVIGKDKKLIGSFPVLLGKTKGEAPNRANPDSDIAGPYATTPAGKYKIGRNSVPQNWSLMYKGRIFNIIGTSGLAIHMTYPGEYKKRMRALNTPTAKDNRQSWGCINVSKQMFDKYLANQNNITENSTLFITPDDENLSLNPETGKTENQISTRLQSSKNLLKTNV